MSPYGLYLWHWPILIVFFTLKERDEIGWRGALLVLGLAFVLTMLTRWALNPAISWATAKSASRALVFAVVVIVVAAAPAAVAFAVTSGPQEPITVDSCAGAATLDPNRPECEEPTDFSKVMPSPEALRSDAASKPACWSTGTDEDFQVCTLGPADAERHLLALGDSHNYQWVEAYEEIAISEGWRIDVASRSACGWSNAVRHQESAELSALCERWNKKVNEYVSTHPHIDAIVVAESAGAKYDSVQDRVDGYVSAWTSANGVPILAMRDNSMFEPSIMNCVTNEKYVESGACTVPRDVGLRKNGFDEASALVPNARILDLTNYMCTAKQCPMVIGNVVVSRDGSHLSRTFVQTLTPYLAESIDAALGESENH